MISVVGEVFVIRQFDPVTKLSKRKKNIFKKTPQKVDLKQTLKKYTESKKKKKG